MVQQGIRMAQFDGYNFDMRVVVINKSPEFVIFRLSSNPMTNAAASASRLAA